MQKTDGKVESIELFFKIIFLLQKKITQILLATS